MREGVALSIHGYIIFICFYMFMIFLNYFFTEMYCIIVNLIFFIVIRLIHGPLARMMVETLYPTY